jgi:hypothetical protein
VIRRCAATVVAVVAFPALARAIDRRAIHRYDRFTELFGAGVSVLSPDLIARLLAHPDGSFRGTPAGARRYWLINQVAGDREFRQAQEFADQVRARLSAANAGGGAGAAIDGVIVGALQSDRLLMYRPLMNRALMNRAHRAVTPDTEET